MATATLRQSFRNAWVVGLFVLILLIMVLGIRGWAVGPRPDVSSAAADGGSSALDAGKTVHSPSAVERPDRFRVAIRRPSGPPFIELQQPDPLGRTGRVSCSTCHSIRAPNLENRAPKDLKQFHQDMPLRHGNLACYVCHNPHDSDTLRLADGTAVRYADVMSLCAQCHGDKVRDYARGSHGGMTGYWDLRRGGRLRNNCIDCHDPHVPKFPLMRPTFKPRDCSPNPLGSDELLHQDETH